MVHHAPRGGDSTFVTLLTLPIKEEPIQIFPHLLLRQRKQRNGAARKPPRRRDGHGRADKRRLQAREATQQQVPVTLKEPESDLTIEGENLEPKKEYSPHGETA